MKLKLIAKKEEAPNVTTFVFEPAQEVVWQAGQYMHYVLPHENPDDRGIERWFTISSALFEKHITITTRNSGEKGSSFKRALFALSIGAEIEADGPEGDFTLADPNVPYVLIAGGIGITPVRAMLLDTDARGASITGTLLYASRDEHIVFKDELDGLREKHATFTLRHVINPERIDEAYIKNAVPNVSTPFFYVSGPEPMVKSLEKVLLGMGVPSDHIKLDDFPGYEI